MRSQQQLASGAAASDLMTDFALSFASQAACSAGCPTLLSVEVVGVGHGRKEGSAVIVQG